jgi:hypothetical protein
MPQYHGNISSGGTIDAERVVIGGVDVNAKLTDLNGRLTTVESPTFTGTVTLPSDISITTTGDIVCSTLGTSSNTISDIHTDDFTVHATTNINGGTLEVDDSVYTRINGGTRLVIQNQQNGGNDRGIFFWSHNDTDWGAYMAGPGAGNSMAGATAVSGAWFSHAALRHRCTDSINNGFVWENSTENLLMSLRGDTGGANLWVRGGVNASGYWLSSDDRLKFNEVVVVDGLSVMRQLSPQSYDKSGVLNDSTDTHREVGLIAQEVWAIPQLKHTVQESPDQPTSTDNFGTTNNRLHVNYNDIHCYTIAAVKELDSIVQTMAATIATLTARITALEQ